VVESGALTFSLIIDGDAYGLSLRSSPRVALAAVWP